MARQAREENEKSPGQTQGMACFQRAKSVCAVLKHFGARFTLSSLPTPPPSYGALKRFAKSRVRIAHSSRQAVASEIKLCVSAMSHAFMFLFSVHLD